MASKRTRGVFNEARRKCENITFTVFFSDFVMSFSFLLWACRSWIGMDQQLLTFINRVGLVCALEIFRTLDETSQNKFKDKPNDRI